MPRKWNICLFVAKSLDQRRLDRCISNELSNKAAGQGGNNQNGWKSNKPIMSSLIYKNSSTSYIESESKKSYKPKTPYKVFMNNKIHTDVVIAESTLLSVIGREEQKGKIYSFGHKNFYVITRYNRSRLYALAVFTLSQQIKKHKSKSEQNNL